MEIVSLRDIVIESFLFGMPINAQTAIMIQILRAPDSLQLTSSLENSCQKNCVIVAWILWSVAQCPGSHIARSARHIEGFARSTESEEV